MVATAVADKINGKISSLLVQSSPVPVQANDDCSAMTTVARDRKVATRPYSHLSSGLLSIILAALSILPSGDILCINSWQRNVLQLSRRMETVADYLAPLMVRLIV